MEVNYAVAPSPIVVSGTSTPATMTRRPKIIQTFIQQPPKFAK
jgi:hypothetical protein